MPLWKIYHPVGTFSSNERREIAEQITSIYKMLPRFYVSVVFQAVAADSFYVGGEPASNFVRIWVDHIARTFNNDEIKRRFLALCSERLDPYIASRGLRWEMHVDETPFSLWSIDGLIPPLPDSDAEKRWKADNRPSAYEANSA